MQKLGKALATAQASSPSKLESLNLQKVIDERMSLSEAIEAAGKIIRCYPNGGANAGDGYIGALAATFAAYPKQVARECANTPRGIVAECKFLPTVADVVSFCERHSKSLYDHFDRQRRTEEQIAQRQKPPTPADKGAKKYTYAEFLEWAKTNNVKARPIGATEPGGYLGSQRRTTTRE